MPSAKVTSKGQITIPQEVRERLGVSEGDRVEFVYLDDGGFALKPATRSIKDLKGIIPLRRRRPVTLAEMDDAIAAGAAKGSKPGRRVKKK
jgi:antitoxin PrlF